MSDVRVVLPVHLRTLAGVSGREVCVKVDDDGPLSAGHVLDALEAEYPVLRGTIRDRATGRRRPFVRFFVGEEDLSHERPDAPLPDAVVTGDEPFYIVGAMAGG